MNRMLMACCVPLVLGMSLTAWAQSTVDMSKFTCEQLLQGSGNSVEAAIWISGYYNGRKKNAKIDLNQFKENAGVVIAECKESPKTTVMQTVNKLMARKK